ncbi:MAG: hypothetical protein V1746_08275 [bacterium]
MYAIYKTTAGELDENFLKSLKETFKDRPIEIAVYESDETEYLLRSPLNREKLLRAIKNVENNCNLVTPDQSQFQ